VFHPSALAGSGARALRSANNYMAISNIITFWLQTIFYSFVFVATLYGCIKIFRAKSYSRISILLAGILLNVFSRMLWNVTFLILSGGKGWINYSSSPTRETIFEINNIISDTLGYIGYLLIPIGLYIFVQESKKTSNTSE
jgi:hypothetical protein